MKKKKTEDTLTSTAKAIGSTLGMLASKVGIATAPAKPARKKKSVSTKTKAVAKKAAKKAATKRAVKSTR